jgi:DNA replication protein DnaC
MNNIRVQFTVPNVNRVVNLDVMVNGENRKIKYRVETFDFDSKSGSDDNLVSVLRSRITNYDKDWEIYHIGNFSEGKIPVTFRFKG